MTETCFELIKKELFAESIEYSCDFDLGGISSFRIGGAASVCAFPTNEKELIFTVEAAKRSGVKYKVIGRGSNLLFSDNGYSGLIVCTSKFSAFDRAENGNIVAQGGASLISLSRFAEKNSLSGLEFATGIPGSVGGAVFMNAGAYGSEISAVLVSCTVYDCSTSCVKTLSKAECEFSYRKSVFQKKTEYIILSVELCLTEGVRDEISEKMRDFTEQRRTKQPKEHSAGSTFKRPEGYIAAKLIDDAGLKGTRVGDAAVSEKHAGFIVNLKSATSGDVLALMDIVKKRVFELYGVALESEIEYVE